MMSHMQMGNDFILRWENGFCRANTAGLTLHYCYWINIILFFFKAGHGGTEGRVSATRASGAGCSRPGFQPCVEPTLFVRGFVEPAMPWWLCPRLLPAGQGTLLRHFQHQNTRQRLFPNGFQVLIATPGGMEPARGRTARVTPQGHLGTDRRPPRAPARGATPLRPEEPPRPRSLAGRPCSRQRRGLCRRDRGSAGSQKQGRLQPWCSHGGGTAGPGCHLAPSLPQLLRTRSRVPRPPGNPPGARDAPGTTTPAQSQQGWQSSLRRGTAMATGCSRPSPWLCRRPGPQPTKEGAPMDTCSRFPMRTSATRAQDPCAGGQP